MKADKDLEIEQKDSKKEKSSGKSKERNNSKKEKSSGKSNEVLKTLALAAAAAILFVIGGPIGIFLGILTLLFAARKPITKLAKKAYKSIREKMAAKKEIKKNDQQNKQNVIQKRSLKKNSNSSLKKQRDISNFQLLTVPGTKLTEQAIKVRNKQNNTNSVNTNNLQTNNTKNVIRRSL